MRLEYWDFFTPPTLAKAFPDGFPGYALEHAAVLETSMMLHYHPELVRLDRIPNDPPADFPPYDIYPTRTEWVPPSGVLSSAKSATKEKGTAMVNELTTLISAAVTKEFS
jgi:creatinine amidohydrolase